MFMGNFEEDIALLSPVSSQRVRSSAINPTLHLELLEVLLTITVQVHLGADFTSVTLTGGTIVSGSSSQWYYIPIKNTDSRFVN